MLQLEDVIRQLTNDGFFTVLLPFVLIFTITYAVLMRIAIFKEKPANIAIALVLGLVPVFQHVLYGGQYSAITIINNSIPQIALIIVAVLSLLILLGLWGLQPGWDAKAGGLVVIGAIAFIAYIFASNAGFGWYNLPRWFDQGTLSIVIALLIFGLIIKFITGTSKTAEELKAEKEKGLLKSFGKLVSAATGGSDK